MAESQLKKIIYQYEPAWHTPHFTLQILGFVFHEPGWIARFGICIDFELIMAHQTVNKSNYMVEKGRKNGFALLAFSLHGTVNLLQVEALYTYIYIYSNFFTKF